MHTVSLCFILLWLYHHFLLIHMWPGNRFKNIYELVNMGVLKFSFVNKLYTFQCIGKIFCVEFERVPLKFYTKYIICTLKDNIFIKCWKFKSSRIYKLVWVFEMHPPPPTVPRIYKVPYSASAVAEVYIGKIYEYLTTTKVELNCVYIPWKVLHGQDFWL